MNAPSGDTRRTRGALADRENMKGRMRSNKIFRFAVGLGLVWGSLCALGQPSRDDATSTSRVEVFGSYVSLINFGKLNGVQYSNSNVGAVVGASLYLNNHFGVQGELGYHPKSASTNDCVSTAQAGPVYRFFSGRYTPFLHAEGGIARVGGPQLQPCTNGYGGTVGGGLDYDLPFFHHHLSERVVQVDYEYMRVDYGKPDVFGFSGGLAKLSSVRIGSSFIVHFGNTDAPKKRVELACMVSAPDPIYTGDTVTIIAAPTNLSKKKSATYRWSAAALDIKGTGQTVSVDTAKLTPGQRYDVGSTVSEGSRADQTASCTTSFTVVARAAAESAKKEDHQATTSDPLILNCYATPSSIAAGQSTTITAQVANPGNEALTYAFNASAGRLSASGSTATLDTPGVPPGPVNIDCSASRGEVQLAKAQASVLVTDPIVAAAPKPLKQCALSFERDLARPVRVTNEAKACLDDLALALQQAPDNKVILVGRAAVGEQDADHRAKERALNAREYLVEEKGIDSSRVVPLTGFHAGRTVETYTMPPGTALNDVIGDIFDPATVMREGEAYGSRINKRAAAGKNR